jgi:Tfp pilus assembly protein PilV
MILKEEINMKFKRSKRESARRGERGFSLLETAMASVVMMIVGLGAAGGFAFAIRYNSGAADRAAAMAIAQTTVEKFRTAAFTDSSLNAGTTTATVSDSIGRSYTVTTTVTNSSTTLKRIAVQVVPVVNFGPFNSTATSYYGAVMLIAERCSPSTGANFH